MKKLEEEEILNSKIPIMDPAKKVMQEQISLQIDNNFMSFLENMKSRMRHAPERSSARSVRASLTSRALRAARRRSSQRQER